jgi:hypothetical protein
LKPYKITFEEWKNIQNDILSRYGQKYTLNFALKRDLGWTPRLDQNYWSTGIVYIDFWEPEARTAFLMEYGNRDLA